MQTHERRQWWLFAPTLLLLLGALACFYPVVTSQYNNAVQRAAAQRYAAVPADEHSHGGDSRSTTMQRARAYNDSLEGIPLLDPYQVRKGEGEDANVAAHDDYLAQLADGELMARLRVPAGHIDLGVRHGTDPHAISSGAGHLYGTSLPVGGKGTHAVLTSHTGMTSATLFDHLADVRVGDYVFVDVSGETLAYRVDQTKVVLPDQTEDLRAEPGRDLLTLFTCTPYGINTHRLLVRAERTDFTPEVDSVNEQSRRESSSNAVRLEPWQSPFLLLGAVASIMAFHVWPKRRSASRASSVAGGHRTGNDR